MDAVLDRPVALALLTCAGGAVVVPVVEVDGVLVEVESGAPVPLLDVVVVVGLPALR